MSIPIHPGVRTLVMDRMVVGYHALHRYDELVIRLKAMGIRPLDKDGVPQERLLQIDEAYDWASTIIESLAIFNEQRTVCYFCNSSHDHSAGRLCNCYRQVLVQDFYDLRDVKLISSLRPGEIVTTSQCADCGIPVPIQARIVQRFYQANPRAVYKGRKWCHKDWLARKHAREELQREQRKELERVQAEAKDAKVNQIDLSGVELPRGEA